MKIIKKLVYLGRKGIEKPDLIVPFLKRKMKIPVINTYTWYKTRNLERQKDLLNDLQEEEEYLLIILDACRYDALNEVIDEFFDQDLEVKKIKNEARNTFEYGRKIWGDSIYTVDYVSGAVPINSRKMDYDKDEFNSLYDGFVPAEHLLNLHDAWLECWDDSIGISAPECVTEKALEVDGEQMVVHYFQPHAPFIGEEQELGYTEGEDGQPAQGNPVDEEIWRKCKTGEIDRYRLAKLYMSNLRRVMETVVDLLDEMDHEKVVITADHGEALGEWGVYAHPHDLDHPYVRTVPYVTIREH